MSKKGKSFEASLKRLQEISDLLEGSDITLEDSIKLYEEGIKLSRECYAALEKAELKIDELNNELEKDFNKSN